MRRAQSLLLKACAVGVCYRSIVPRQLDVTQLPDVPCDEAVGPAENDDR